MREKILDILEKNGRIDLKEMAIMLGYSEAEVANEIADMEKEHIICGYNTLDSIAERLYKYDDVTSVYLMSGGFDFTVIIEGKTMKSVAQFVAAKLAPLDSVLSTSTHFVLKKYKDYGTIIEDEAKDERMLITP